MHLDFIFDMPAGAPIFIGWILVGAIAGYAANKRDRTWVACLVFIPPLAFLLYDIPDLLHQPIDGGWTGVWTAYFSKDCGGSECLSELMDTAPLYASVAYSIAAAWALHRSRRASGIASPAEPPAAPPIPAAAAGGGGGATSWKRSATLYAKHLAIAWPGIFFACFAAHLILQLLPRHPGFLLSVPSRTPVFGAPVYIGWLAAGAIAGYAVNKRDRTRVACLVFIPPLALLLLHIPSVVHASIDGGWTAIWTTFFSKNCSGLCVSQAFETTPLYAAAAYSIAAAWALRRSRRIATNAPARVAGR